MPDLSLFKVHLENTRALDRAFKLVSKDCRLAIATQDSATVDSLTKTCGFLLGARMENRLFRLLYEPGGFDDSQLARIVARRSIQDSWEATVTEAYAARRNLRPSQVPAKLSVADAAQYDVLIGIIRDDLAPLIALRNILAHGQWHRALNSDRLAVSQDGMRTLTTTRLWHLTIKANLLDHLVSIIHDLIVTEKAFERDFNKRWSQLQTTKRRLELDNYEKWETMLVRQRANSLENRRRNTGVRTDGTRREAQRAETTSRNTAAQRWTQVSKQLTIWALRIGRRSGAEGG